MNTTAKEVLQFVQENDVKFIRLAFCDPNGVHKNISVMPGELERVFDSGLLFDASAIPGFCDISHSDLLLCPDPSTLHVLPWRPMQGRVVRFYCNIRYPDGTTFECDARALLLQVMGRLAKEGCQLRLGTSCKFYLFNTDEEGAPTKVPYDHGGFFDVAPLDRGENVRREICLCLEEMGISPETSHHDRGPGQNEIVFKYDNALAAADNFLTYKSVVKAMAARSGLFASFAPRPLPDQNGNGLHVNMSLHKNGVNLFSPHRTDEMAPEAASFMAGILARAAEMTAFTNPLCASYDRLGHFEAPRYVAWGRQNRSALVRIPSCCDDLARMELRSPDPSVNPYLVFALLLSAGLEGLQRGLALPAPAQKNLYTADLTDLSELAPLPATLGEAIEAAQGSSFAAGVLGREFLDRYVALKTAQWQDYAKSSDKTGYCDQHYFRVI